MPIIGTPPFDRPMKIAANAAQIANNAWLGSNSASINAGAAYRSLIRSAASILILPPQATVPPRVASIRSTTLPPAAFKPMRRSLEINRFTEAREIASSGNLIDLLRHCF
ncbi:MAG TPA: hypothetical protein VFR71_01610 [Methyloceanibacter sp.]|nr:hypothetical protein [Methyloceanibacter sp.]